MAAAKRSGLEGISLPGKLAIGLLFTVLVGAAYFVLFYGEVESAIASQEQALGQKHTELDDAKQADKAYNQDLTELERRKLLARKQQKILPDEAESPAFLSTVQTVATISGVRLTSWTPQEEQLEEFYAKVPMELKLKGKYHQVAKFFNGIGQVDRIINMENINMTVVDERRKSAAGKDKAKPGQEALPTVEENVQVEVTCLATAFRALKGGEGAGGTKRRGARGAPADKTPPPGGKK